MPTLIKSTISTNSAELLLKDVVTRNSKYYLFLGKTYGEDDRVQYLRTISGGPIPDQSVLLSNFPISEKVAGSFYKVANAGYFRVSVGSAPFFANVGDNIMWTSPTTVEKVVVIDSLTADAQVRNDIVFLKEIKPSDTCLVIPRINWKKFEVYDKYDDALNTELTGINLRKGGLGYTGDAPKVQIISNSGSGAEASAILNEAGEVVDIILTKKGTGYDTAPVIAFVEGSLAPGGYPAEAVGTITRAASGARKLEDARMYVITEDFNVYKCLDNNLNGPSLVKPYSTSEAPIRLSDGYLWKFMYSVPVYLRNKFLTPEYLPVINILSDNFYSNGELPPVTILSPGKNYTWAKIKIDGDGVDIENPYMIKEISVDTKGSGYGSIDVLVDKPFLSDSVFLENASVLQGQIIEHDERFYRVILNGNLGSAPPIHRNKEVPNGTTILSFIGETARVEKTLVDGKLDKVEPIGKIYEIELDVGGSGYTVAPSVTFDGVFQHPAHAYCVVQEGRVVEVVVDTMGDGFIGIPNVVVGKKWAPAMNLTLGEQVFHGNNLYTADQSLTTGSNPPIHTTGIIGGLRYAGVAAKARVRMIYGYGYSKQPSVTISSPGGSGAKVYLVGEKNGAKLVPMIHDGSIKGVIHKRKAIGYTYANLEVIGDGEGASLKVDLMIGDINTPQGSSQLLATNGAIDHIELISGGYGYAELIPQVTIVGDGEGATAMAYINPTDGGDKLLRVKVINPGNNYSWAEVVFTGGSGKGAKARAIIGPYLGHSKDPIYEMATKRVMFYTSFINETVFGFPVRNQYRQVGILKDPRSYSDRSYVATDTITPCLILTSTTTIDQTKFLIDHVVKVVTSSEITTGRKFRVISVDANKIMLQSLENYIPQPGDTMDNMLTGTQQSTFTVLDVVEPTLDKYSGQILYVEDKSPFKPSTREKIAIRTVLSF